MNSSLHPHIQSPHSVSVRGAGEEGESVLGPCFVQASRKVSNKNDNLPLLHENRTSTSGSLNPQLNNMDTNRTDLSREKSPNHRFQRNTVSGNDGSESERWLREMSMCLFLWRRMMSLILHSYLRLLGWHWSGILGRSLGVRGWGFHLGGMEIKAVRD